MTQRAVVTMQRRVHHTVAPTISLVTTLLVITDHGTIRLAITRPGTTRPEITRRAMRAHATATVTIPRVNHQELRLSFEGFLKRPFVASLAVDCKSSFLASFEWFVCFRVDFTRFFDDEIFKIIFWEVHRLKNLRNQLLSVFSNKSHA